MSDVVLNKAFRDANETHARYRVLMGGAGSGKSTDVAMDYIAKLTDEKYEGANLLVVRASEHSHAQSTFAELARAIDAMGLTDEWDVWPSKLTMTCKATGAQVYFRGCNDQRAIERLKSIQVKSGKLCWVWIEEATELRQSDVDIIDDRLRGELPDGLWYQITMSFNPVSASHWIKGAFWDSTDPNVFTCHTTYKDNKFIDPQYAERMERRRLTDPVGYRVYALGEWGVTDGLVFENWTLGEYKVDDFDNISIGTDFGYNHAHATLTLGFRDGDVYVLSELVCYNKTKTEILDELARKKVKKNVPMWCDSAEPASIKEFRKGGYLAQPVVKEPNSVKAQIDWLKDRRIFIDGSCVHLLKEIQQYRWQVDRVTGEFLDIPITVNDDCIAALRYGIEPWRKARGLRTMDKGAFGL